jgi:hypothetical protein
VNGRGDDISFWIFGLETHTKSVMYSFQHLEIERRTGSGKGLATWIIPVTSFNTESNAPSVVMSGTITNSSLF